MTPKLVIFDCDGVLVDSEGISNEILVENLARHGLSLSRDKIASLFVGGTIRSVGEEATRLGAEIPDGWVDDIYADIYAKLALGTELIDGVEAVLDRLDKSNIRYAVGSNGSLEKMNITLGQHPTVWARLKDHLFSAHSYGVAKPDPELYLIAAKAFGIAPEHCAVIEDSPTGCIAARRAGMRCFGIAEHDDGARLAQEGAQVFNHMSQLPELLGI